jgi:hypothetical protein
MDDDMRVACPLYRDGWVHRVSHPDYPGGLFWCDECEAIWLTEGDLSADHQQFGVTFTRWRSDEEEAAFWSAATDLGHTYAR